MTWSEEQTVKVTQEILQSARQVQFPKFPQLFLAGPGRLCLLLSPVLVISVIVTLHLTETT